MVSVVLRSVKGSNLTPAEGDSNINNLNIGKREVKEQVIEISTPTNMEAYKTYVFTAITTGTLPAPSPGVWVIIINASGVSTPQVLRNNTELIMGLAENLTLDVLMKPFKLTYINATKGWVVS